MPRFVMDIPETYQSVTRPVARSITDDLLDRLGVKQFNLNVVFTGPLNQSPTTGSTLQSQTANNNLMPADNRLTLELEENYSGDQTLTTAVQRPEHIPIFKDTSLGVYLRPVYQTIKNTIQLTYSASSRIEAENWLKAMRRRTNTGTVDHVHYVQYHYAIPNQLMNLLSHLHELRENESGYQESFAAWVKPRFTDRLTVIANQAGQNYSFAISETQVQVIGWYDFALEPPKPENQPAGHYEVKFSYTYQYDRPESMVANYPLIVHNQFISELYREDIKPHEIVDFKRHGPHSQSMFDLFRYGKDVAAPWLCEPGIPIPMMDDWILPYKVPGYQCLVRILTQLNPEDKGDLVALTDLGEWQIYPVAIPYLKYKPYTLTQAYDNIFNITVFRWDDLLDQSGIRVDENLNVRYNNALNLRDNHRFVLSLLTSPELLSYQGLTDLAKFGELANTYLTIINPAFTPLPLNPDGSVNLDKLIDAVKEIGRTDTWPVGGEGLPPYARPLFVNLSKIVVLRRP